MQVVSESFCNHITVLAAFGTLTVAAGIGANIVQIHQGVKALELIAGKLDDISVSLAAKTAITAQEKFPEYVYAMIGERLGQTMNDEACEHWFFLYHPDNDWYPRFYHLLEEKSLGPRFCGYTNQIDTAFVFMLAARRWIEHKRRKRPWLPHVKLHLLIPAYQNILINEPLKIPEEIGDFIMEGRIHNNKAFVTLNLPESQKIYIVDIGQWVSPKPGWIASLFGSRPSTPKHRVLGTKQQSPEDDDRGYGEGSTDMEDNGGANDADGADNNDSNLASKYRDENNHTGTVPLQNLRKRSHRRSRRGKHGSK
jgi:hypothetical protein